MSTDDDDIEPAADGARSSGDAAGRCRHHLVVSQSAIDRLGHRPGRCERGQQRVRVPVEGRGIHPRCHGWGACRPGHLGRDAHDQVYIHIARRGLVMSPIFTVFIPRPLHHSDSQAHNSCSLTHLDSLENRTEIVTDSPMCTAPPGCPSNFVPLLTRHAPSPAIPINGGSKLSTGVDGT